MRHLFSTTCLFVFVSVLSVGCTPTGDSDSDSHAKPDETFDGAVSSLMELRDTIRDGIAAGDPDKAHGPLHKIGHVIESLPKLAEKEGKSAEQVSSLKGAADSLLDAFGEIDKTFHGGEGSTYDEVAPEIDVAMNTIAGIAGVENSAAAPVGDGGSGSSTSEGSGEPQDVESSLPSATDEPVEASGGQGSGG